MKKPERERKRSYQPPLPVRRRAVVGLVLATVGLTAMSSNASGAPPAAPSKSVLNDCSAHRGALTGQYARSTLVTSYAAFRAQGLEYQNCGQALASRIAGTNRRGSAGGTRIVTDCLEHGGRLSRSYASADLKRAFAGLSTNQRTETRCTIGIASQFNGKRGRAQPLVPPKKADEPAARMDTPHTVQWLGRAYPVLLAQPRPIDTPPAPIPTLIDSANANRPTDQPRADINTARAADDKGRMFLVPGAGTVCSALVIGTVSTAMSCGSSADPDVIHASITIYLQGKVAVWGPLPQQTRNLKVLTHDGRWAKIQTDPGILLVTFPKTPRLITYEAVDGATHYLDWTSVLCMPGQPCPKR